jgi:predicted nucleotidyltransferase
MSEQELRKSYAISFVSFIMKNPKLATKIDMIILYGSVAKSTSFKDSDIDIFIESEKSTEKFRKDIDLALKDFHRSKEAIIFKLTGIDNEIKPKIGRLDEWPDLKRSILSDGIVLWGRMEHGKPKGTKHMVIFHWGNVEKNRGAFLNKVYGYKVGGKKYEGVISRNGGSKLGKSCVMLPIGYREKMIEIIKKYGVSAKAVEVFV